jgi:hypothetical protein
VPRHPKVPKQSNSVQIGDQAALSADHKTANVVLTVTCNDFPPAPIRVTVQQNAVKGTGSGTGYKCNGHAQRVVVPVAAGSGTFHQGDAEASESVKWHSSNGSSTSSSSSSNSATIQLT